MRKSMEEYIDVDNVTVAEVGEIRLDSDMLCTHISGDYSTGIKTLSWPDRVWMISGVDDGDNVATVGQTLTPEQAKEVGQSLIDAAEKDERLRELQPGDDE